MLFLYQKLPLYTDPIAFSIGSFSVHWYAISYLIGFAVVYGLLMLRVKKGECFECQNVKTLASLELGRSGSKRQNELRTTNYELRTILLDFLLLSFISAIIGGRLGYVLLYNFSYFLSNPISIISPLENGKFVGIYGMSYHGALLGIIISSLIFLKIKKIAFWRWADFVIPAVPLGYFFGRIGNFLNGELYGRVTNSSFGMYFASDPLILRFPSQFLEALLEGLVLFIIIWKMRKIKLPEGVLFTIYLIGYGIFRILGEYFREPDSQVGFLFGFLTMGQLLSVCMIIAGVFLIFKKSKQVI